jgi:hypothetical protein
MSGSPSTIWSLGRMSTQTVLLTGGFDVSWFEAGQHRLV